ncbi:MAG: hypothetical protein MR771_06385 [Treponema succinifaciens]|uniref:hypothetical protein n=1 Tax=Treponema succinifaciens TaxID=167 RepID=UPI002354AE5F|nr:hypothetical protein [Treponema succinifaciens]MCI6912776.1 hypothetical protein [Treponema succinifaciens]
MRKFGFTALVSFLFLLASCMNMGGSSGEDGAIRVALPGSGSRGSYPLSKENAKTYKVALLLDGENLKTQTSEAGGADIVFDELEPATYTVQVEAYDTNDVLLARKSETVKVTAGNTAECSIALKLFASSILDSGYILWKYSELKKYFKSFSSISENTEVENSQFYSSHQYVSLAETASAQYVMKMDIDTSSSSYSYSITNLSNNSSSSIKTDNVTLFYDCLYYDDTTDSLWVGAYDSSSRKQLYFARINGAPDSTNETTLQSSNFIIDSTGSDTSTFAVQGSTLYFAYKSYDNGTCYLQRASITENADGTFAVSKVGSAKSVSDLGVSGAITDIAILYDGTVYVLVSNVGNSSGDSGDLFNYYYDKSNTMYSRGALLKIQSTSSGFEVVDTLGWTGSSRQIAPVGEAKDESTLTILQPLTAYIPSLSEKSNKFYGPRRFVAIKPKEIAIADCGANFVMPNCNKKLYGKRFDHNRVVTVSLSSFAINVVTELRNIKFSDLTLGGSGTSGGYIYAKDCKYKDTDNNEIEEQ